MIETSQLCIVVAEDDPDTLEFLTDLFTQMGDRVVGCPDGIAAQACIAET
jgi:DNA-binding response OmpR family regulator